MPKSIVKEIIVIGEFIQLVLQHNVLTTTFHNLQIELYFDINNSNVYCVEENEKVKLIGSTWPQMQDGLEALKLKLPESKVPCYGCEGHKCSVLCTGTLLRKAA